MPRVKGGYTTRRRRKAVLKLAKGYYGSKHTLYKTAHEQVMRSFAYAYRDRKNKKREFRKLWISRINAACALNGMKYSRFINGLANAGVEVNRKMLAEMAVADAAGFASLVAMAQKGLANPAQKVAENVIVLKTASKAEKAKNVTEAPKAEVKEAKKEVAPKAAKVETVKETKVEAKVEKAPKAEVKEAKKEAPKAAAVDYDSMTVAELKAIAKEKGITGISAMKKADLIAALK